MTKSPPTNRQQKQIQCAFNKEPTYSVSSKSPGSEDMKYDHISSSSILATRSLEYHWCTLSPAAPLALIPDSPTSGQLLVSTKLALHCTNHTWQTFLNKTCFTNHIQISLHQTCLHSISLSKSAALSSPFTKVMHYFAFLSILHFKRTPSDM